MLFQIKSYFKFLWKSKNAHGVHSPFVFDLVTKCFYDKKKYPEYSILRAYRNSLIRNKDFIEVKDFGAGSKVFKSNKRQVAKIARTAGITSKRAELLFRVVNYFKPENVLEIGTSLGLATSAIASGNQKATVTTLEGCPETAEIARLQFQRNNFNINLVVSEFDGFLKNQHTIPKHRDNAQNLIYFDGNHQKSATLNYFELLLPTITNDSIWIFDDIHWSQEMETAWETIKKHPKVTVTLDTFHWGFVFFRKEQEKEHFIIRGRDSTLLNAFLGLRKLYGLLD